MAERDALRQAIAKTVFFRSGYDMVTNAKAAEIADALLDGPLAPLVNEVTELRSQCERSRKEIDRFLAVYDAAATLLPPNGDPHLIAVPIKLTVDWRTWERLRTAVESVPLREGTDR